MRISPQLSNVLQPLAGFAVLVALVLSLALQLKKDPPQAHISPQDMIIFDHVSDHEVVPILVGEQRLWVEIVKTPESISTGLSYRSEIGRMPSGQTTPAQGMLFLLPERRQPTFWMKAMQFDLDMVWIDQGKIVALTERVPHSTSDDIKNLPVYSPPQPVDMVLEIPAGTAKKWQLQSGDRVIFPEFSGTNSQSQ